MAVATAMVPSDRFDLTNWKLTLPVDKSGGVSGNAVEITNLQGYQNPEHFYLNSAGGMVFEAAVDGATTSGSHYARSELREMNAGKLAAWTLDDGGTMIATLEVDQVPVKSGGGTGRIVIGQIHGQEEELVRLYWENNSVYFVSDHAGKDDKETTFKLADSSGAAPNVSLNEKFSYAIDTHDGLLTVKVLADNHVYSLTTAVSQTWDTDHFYFKAGAYLGVGDTGSGAGTIGTGEGETTFYSLQADHSDHPPVLPTTGPGPVVPVEPPPVVPPVVTPPVVTPPVVVIPPTPPVTPPVPAPDKPVPVTGLIGKDGNDALQGGAGDETMKGRGGNDLIQGGAGNDKLWGEGGNDKLVGGIGNDWLKGGDGKDEFVFGKGHGNDVVDEFRHDETLTFEHGIFASVQAAKAALEQTKAGVLLHTGSDSSVLFTHTTMSDVQDADWHLL